MQLFPHKIYTTLVRYFVARATRFNTREDMDDLNCTYILKEDSIGPPERYIESNAEKVDMDNGKEF